MEIKTIQDLNDRPEFVLVTDSQEIEAVLGNIGRINEVQWGCLFVKFNPENILSGIDMFEEVYGCEFSVPELRHSLTKLHPSVE